MQKVVAGILTNYEVTGEGKPMLVLHGWGGVLSEWRNISDELGGKHKVILVDLPGFGGSQKPGDDWGIYEYADWVEEFMKKTELREPTVLGHSFGGRIAIILGARRRAERLVLVDAAGMETRNWKSRLMAIAAPMFSWLPDEWRRWARSEDYRSSGKMKGIYKRVVGEDLRNNLKDIICPALIIWGEKDQVLPFAEARMLHVGIKNSVLRVVWGAGHWPHLEKPKELLQILSEEEV